MKRVVVGSILLGILFFPLIMLLRTSDRLWVTILFDLVIIGLLVWMIWAGARAMKRNKVKD